MDSIKNKSHLAIKKYKDKNRKKKKQTELKRNKKNQPIIKSFEEDIKQNETNKKIKLKSKRKH